MRKRIRADLDKNPDHYYESGSGLDSMSKRLSAWGGSNQWIRMREDKLRSLKKALLSSYQKAIVQKYNVKKDSLANNLISIITLLQDKQELSENQIGILDSLENDYPNLSLYSRDEDRYIHLLEQIVDSLTTAEPYFKALINHDKLKVDYEDKIISIPFKEAPEGSEEEIDTDFHNGTVFKWVHGNKQEWTPDTYWIVYMQYSEQTAYFRAEIRKADEEIQIIVIDDEGNENTVSYRGWMTGPNETTALWNVKKGVVWNDMNYTKLLYITKDEDTLAYFQRFDRIIINGKPWQVQAYNDAYSTSKRGDYSSGIIRVALKETYTSTDQFVKELKNAEAAQIQADLAYDAEHIQARIDGPTAAHPYDILIYKAKNYEQPQSWYISDDSFVKVLDYTEDTLRLEVISKKANKEGFIVKYGQDSIQVPIESL